MQFDGMPIEVHIEGDTVRVAGEVDLSTAAELEEALVEFIETGRVPVLDLTAVTYFDSSGIQALVRARESLSDGQGPIRITGVNQHTDRVFRLIGLERFFTIERQSAGV